MEKMEKRLFFLINRVQHQIFKHVDQRCEAEMSCSVSQVAAMFYVAKHRDCLVKELAQALGMNNPGVSGLVQRMERNDLVKKSPCSLDGRASRLSLTALGQEKLQLATPLIQEMNEVLTEGFSEQEIATVLKFLNRMLERF